MKQNSLSKPQISVYLSRRWLVTLPTLLFVAPPARSLGDALNRSSEHLQPLFLAARTLVMVRDTASCLQPLFFTAAALFWFFF